MTSETIERVRKAVNALDYIQHDWQQKDGRDTFNEQCEIIRAAFPAAPVKPGDVAEAVQRLKKYIERRKKAKQLDFNQIHNFDDKYLLTVSDIESVITAAQQRPEVDADEFYSAIYAAGYRIIKSGEG